MSDFGVIDSLKRWIPAHCFPDYEIEREPIRGNYGLVFLLKAKHSSIRPANLAVKTLNPEQLPDKPLILEELQREFGLWLRLPSHQNVLGAGIFKEARFPFYDPSALDKVGWISLPIMQMARMDGCLLGWIGNTQISYADKLSALAQALNGLTHLYANGVKEHGDLKPSNLLVKEIRKTQNLAPGVWLNDHPWIVQVADLGWANAWADYGYPSKGFRPYVAPERIGDNPRVIQEKSDMFSIGMIAAELIQGHHPSPNLKKAKSHPSKWLRQIAAADWDLSGIASERIKHLILSCIDAEPDNRPSTAVAIDRLCEEFKQVQGSDIAPTLRLWTEAASEPLVPYISSTSEEIERLGRTLGLGAAEESKSLERLRKILKAMNPTDIYSLEDWVEAASKILDFLKRRDGRLDREEASSIRLRARTHFEVILGNVDHRGLARMAAALSPEDLVTAFERFSHLVGHLAELAKIDFDHAYKGEWDVSQLALSGFAFHMASMAHMHGERGIIEYLDLAVDLSLIEPVPYFFRAMRKEDVLIREEIGSYSAEGVSKRDVIKDLEIACRLAPNWLEPHAELKRIRNTP